MRMRHYPCGQHDKLVYLWQHSCDIKKNIESFIPRQEILGLGLRSRNNLNISRRCRLLKTQENFPIQALKPFNRLSHDMIALPIRRLESRVDQWLGINPFYSLEEFYTVMTSAESFSNTIHSF